MKQHLHKISNFVAHVIGSGGTPIVYLEAGHYDPRFGADIFSESSLKEALVFGDELLRQFGRSFKLVFGVLVDDLGLECGESECTLSQGPPSFDTTRSLPSSLEEILKSNSFIKRDRVLLFSERTTKNRAIKQLKKALKANSNPFLITRKEVEENQILFTYSSNEDILLASFKEHTYKAKCPSIMGQHYADCTLQLKNLYPKATDLIVVDWCEKLDASKVKTGAEAGFKVFLDPTLFQSISLFNIFYIDDEGDCVEHYLTDATCLEKNQTSLQTN